MRTLILYLENSIFGFYFEEKIENKSKKEATKKLFKEIKEGKFLALTSPRTVKELSFSRERYFPSTINELQYKSSRC